MANNYSITFTSASQQYLSVANTTILQPTGNFAVEAWIKTSTAADQFIFFTGSISGSVDAGIWFKIDSAGKAYLFSFKNTGSSQGTDYQLVLSTTSVNNGAWHHLAGVWDGTNLYIYVDKVLEGTTPWAFAPAYAATTYVQVGAIYNGINNASFFDGELDDLRLWGVNRTASDISTNYQRELAGNETNLNGYWKYNNSYNDSTSNNNNWTPSGLPTFTSDVPFADNTTTSTSTTTTSTSTSTTSTSSSSSTTTSTSRTTSTSTTSTSTTSTITTTSTTTTSTSTTSTSSSTTTTSTSSSSSTSTSTSTTITMDLRLIVEIVK